MIIMRTDPAAGKLQTDDGKLMLAQVHSLIRLYIHRLSLIGSQLIHLSVFIATISSFLPTTVCEILKPNGNETVQMPTT